MPIVNGAMVQGLDRSQPTFDPVRWRQVFPGHELQLRQLRRWLTSLLPNCPARDDLLLVAVELGANAIKHTRTGNGGRFAVEITWHGSTVRITVVDDGSSSKPHLVDDPMAEHGRGLQMVRHLSMRTGTAGDDRGRLMWADLPWESPSSELPAAFPAAFEEAICAGQVHLRRRFPNICTWFGRQTLCWWALPAPPAPNEFLTAVSAEDLAVQLAALQGPQSESR
ncbi:ATP-binding protein [Streptosporangium lutulentum]|uniref:Histidine kinase/HSP90-like ATPase domain-containing protein n=1 Tax=Streptosporangium lutulentum TaxID=1461250 RepID=A0ABT9QUM2_9ACTN|nr:ATP-binding protein [Streptosporangium lutulentum]MDP9850455.1 hypothetical protein [Streptosporangium lutulentum]